MSKASKPEGDGDDVGGYERHWAYLKDWHTQHCLRNDKLDDLAFKTSERYDQWILTISGGALAISLTFLERIASNPATWSYLVLICAWIALVAAIVFAFLGISKSREAIYRAMEIQTSAYTHFRNTSTPQNPGGDPFDFPRNQENDQLDVINKRSRYSLLAGVGLLCIFAVLNFNRPKTPDAAASNLNVNLNVVTTSNLTSIIKPPTTTNAPHP